MLRSGAIGQITSVDFAWMLDTRHGADYFRRWHRNRAVSGSLLVHKATHHFDLVNWWLGARPVEVFAQGRRAFYTPQTADEQFGLHGRGERCRGCTCAGKCPFFLDLAGVPKLKQMYLDCEHADGYFRDRCVFSDQIDIWDTMSLSVRYDSGALMAIPQLLPTHRRLQCGLQRRQGPGGAQGVREHLHQRRRHACRASWQWATSRTP